MFASPPERGAVAEAAPGGPPHPCTVTGADRSPPRFHPRLPRLAHRTVRPAAGKSAASRAKLQLAEVQPWLSACRLGTPEKWTPAPLRCPSLREENVLKLGSAHKSFRIGAAAKLPNFYPSFTTGNVPNFGNAYSSFRKGNAPKLVNAHSRPLFALSCHC